MKKKKNDKQISKSNFTLFLSIFSSISLVFIYTFTTSFFSDFPAIRLYYSKYNLSRTIEDSKRDFNVGIFDVNEDENNKYKAIRDLIGNFENQISISGSSKYISGIVCSESGSYNSFSLSYNGINVSNTSLISSAYYCRYNVTEPYLPFINLDKMFPTSNCDWNVIFDDDSFDSPSYISSIIADKIIEMDANINSYLDLIGKPIYVSNSKNISRKYSINNIILPNEKSDNYLKNLFGNYILTSDVSFFNDNSPQLLFSVSSDLIAIDDYLYILQQNDSITIAKFGLLSENFETSKAIITNDSTKLLIEYIDGDLNYQISYFYLIMSITSMFSFLVLNLCVFKKKLTSFYIIFHNGIIFIVLFYCLLIQNIIFLFEYHNLNLLFHNNYSGTIIVFLISFLIVFLNKRRINKNEDLHSI
ncbi:MAG: hypothetical protein AB7D50_02490 [Bacilli bacterium]